ncbi:MAG: FHA domain-containing protein [Deltaproteobacteria bacterium]|nr:FHA domain-containing protein [Deltaproteobacteria bacterium]
MLVDRTVSRKHAEVRRERDFVIVKDLGSTNGTFYHDARVVEVSVPLGGEISFGKTRVKIVPEEVSVEARPHISDRLGPLIGRDLRMREIFTLIEDIADSDVTGGHRGRDRHRQGAGGQGHPRPFAPEEQPPGGVRLHQPAQGPDRERPVRAREGGLHRRHRAPGRGVRAGGRRHHLPGRAR